MRYPRRRSAAAVALAGFLLAGCGGPAHHPVPRAQAGLTGDPHGVVVLQGHALAILDRLPGLDADPVTAPPASPGPDAAAATAATAATTAEAAVLLRPAAAGTTPPDRGTDAAAITPAVAAAAAPAVQPLTSLRQLSATLVAGLRGGQTLVALDPRHPADVRQVAPALAWFPDLAGTGGWAVTSPNQPTGPGACPRLPHSRARQPRYRLEHRDLATGAVERTPFLLPCGMLPVADTKQGFVTEALRPGAGSAAHPVLDVRLADHRTLRPGRYLARSAVVLDASAGTLLVAASPCASAPCERVLAPGRPAPTTGAPPGGGRLTGAGVLDPTGRYLAAAAAVPPGGGPPRLVLEDLRTGTVKDLGAYRTAGSGPPSDLRTDLPCVWSGSRFLYANPAAGTLTSYDTAGGRSLRRSGLATGGTLQVWGAAG